MKILSLSFGRTARTPALKGAGIALAVTREPEREPGMIVYGACRVDKAELPFGRVDLPRGIFLVGVHPWSQRAASVNLVGDRLVFEDEIEDEGPSYLSSFRCAVDPTTSMVGPFFLHAHLRQHVSAILSAQG